MKTNRRGVLVRTALLCLLISLLFTTGPLLSRSTVDADDPISTPQPSEPMPGVTDTVDPFFDGKLVGRPAQNNPRLDSSLNQLVATYHQEGLPEATALAEMHMMVFDTGRVQVVIETTAEALSSMRETVESLGGEVQTHYRGLLQAMVPVGALESLAGHPEVSLVRQPSRSIPLEPALVGNSTTEGVAASNASAWHSAGHTGAGVRIAVLDGGFEGYQGLLGTDLPASVGTYDWTSSGMGGSKHGTGCAEIAHDMAPGATMDLHKVGTGVEMGNAIDQAIDDGVQIATASIGTILDGPGDGTGLRASIVQNARQNGILYVQAAGNNSEHSWSGTFSNDGSGLHLWAAGQNVNFFGPGDGQAWVIPAGFPITCVLHWDDWTAVTEDLDLHLLGWTGSAWALVASSTNSQSGSYPYPTEIISVQAPAQTFYGFAVEKTSGTGSNCLRLLCSHAGPDLDERVKQRSLVYPADSPDAFTVAAIDVDTFNLESYSSQGPMFGPGGACTGGATRPDAAGFANVSTESYGPQQFNGTSSATPHAAGAAALVKGVFPGYTPDQLQSFLEGRAIDLGSPGKDNLFGSGRLHLGNPPSSNNPPNTPSAPSPANGAGNVSTATMLAWTGGDPDAGDTVTYDVFLDANDNTPQTLVCNDVSMPTCNPGSLNAGTQYFWYVVASDSHSASTTGPTWSFTTASSGGNNPPNTPSAPSPANGASSVPTATALSWTGGDPDAGDTVTYDVFLDANDNTPQTLVCNDVSMPTCNPGSLNAGTQYHWYVVARDNHGASTTGPTWSFTTKSEIRVYLPLVLKNYPPPPPLPGTLYATADATVLQGAANRNFGNTSDMWVGYDHCEGLKVGRSLVKFDVSAIPPGTSIAQATLRLHLENSCDIGERTHNVTVYRTSGNWAETSVTWNSKPGQAEAYGSRSIRSRTWEWYTFDVTGLVRGWVNGNFANQGLTLRGPESSGNSSAQLGFATRNASGTTYDPRIVVTYAGGSTTEAPTGDQASAPAESGPTVRELAGLPSDVPNSGAFTFAEDAAGMAR
jgi:hypothetical protein